MLLFKLYSVKNIGMDIIMKNVIIAIIMFALCVALVIGTVLPVSELISDTGGEVYKTVKVLNDNIK